MDNYEKRVLGNADASLEGRPQEVSRRRLAHKIIQTIMREDASPYSMQQDDVVFWGLHELEEQNGLPEDMSAHDCYQIYRSIYGGRDGA